MFGNVLSKLFSKGSSTYGDDVLSRVAMSQGDDAARGTLSQVGKKLAPSPTANMLRDGANRGMNSPINLTRAETRKLNVGGTPVDDIIPTLYKRTGTSDVDKLDDISSRLMRDSSNGSNDSLVSSVVNDMRTNFSRVGDPQNYVDLSDLRQTLQEVASESGIEKSIQKDLGIIGKKQLDPIAIEKAFKSKAANYRGGATPNDNMANKLQSIGDDIANRIDSSVTPQNIEGGWDIIQDNLLHAHRKALMEGDKVSSEAFKRLAKEYADVPIDSRTIQGARSKLADFVKLQKINKKTAEAKGGGSLSQRLKSIPVVGDLFDSVLGKPLTRASQKTGEAMEKLATKFDNGQAQSVLKKGAVIGGGGLVLANLMGGGNQAPQGGMPGMTPMGGMGTDPSMGGGQLSALGLAGAPQQPEPEPTVGGYTRSDLENGYVAALMAGDAKSADAIGSMIDIMNNNEKRMADSTGGTKDDAAKKRQAGLNTLNTLLQSYERGGGGQGIIGGTLTNLLNTATGGAYNSSAQTYATQARGAAAQIIKALGESGTLSDRDIQAAMDMLPKNTDNEAVAREKISNLMTLLGE